MPPGLDAELYGTPISSNFIPAPSSKLLATLTRL
jgi:hypothetical protein